MTTVDGVLVVADDANRSSRRRRHDQDQDGHDGHSDQKGKGRKNGKGGGGGLRAYPRAVFYMLGNEFCERFSFYGMRSVLTLYLILEHGFRDR
jgi:hypothetical protein